MINKYELVTIVLRVLKLPEQARSYIAKTSDEELVVFTAFKIFKKGFFIAR